MRSIGFSLLMNALLAPFLGASAQTVQAPALRNANVQAISSQDRVYTADQSSNTVTVINPATNEVLGTIALGSRRIGNVLGPVDHHQVNVHGLGFSPDGRSLNVISVSSNAAQVIDTATNEVVKTIYTGRSPHEGFISPDGNELWVAVRGEDYLQIIDLETEKTLARLVTAPGVSKVVFSPDGQRAFANHLFTHELTVIDVSSREITERIPIPEEVGGSADLARTPDGDEVWLGHPNNGKTTVVDARTLEVKAVLDTGPRTNHPNFVTRDGVDYAYVTVGGLNQTKVFRRTEDAPQLVTTIDNSGSAPHGIWPSPDNTRIYVALQKSDAVDVIDTASNRVIETLRVGQDPQALVYVAGAVPAGERGTANLTRQGLGSRIENFQVVVRGAAQGATAAASVRAVEGLEEIDLTARGLPPNTTFILYAQGSEADTETPQALMNVTTDERGGVPEALAFAKFFGLYDQLVLLPEGQRP